MDFMELVTAEGGLDHRLVGAAWRIPEVVELHEDRLAWMWFESEAGPRSGHPGPRMLEDFLRLWDAPGERILAYARKWGVMGFCRHGLPAMHLQSPPPPPHSHLERPCYPSDEPSKDWGWSYEPVALWRSTARRMRALLNIAARLRGDGLGEEQDWRVLYETGVLWKRTGEEERFALSAMLNHWMALGTVRPRLAWHERGPSLNYAFAGIFGALVFQVILAVSAPGGSARCSACSAPYVPARTVSRGKRHYCGSCRPKGALRDAARDYRARVSEARGLSRSGISVSNIARQLSRPEAQVQQWIEASRRRPRG